MYKQFFAGMEWTSLPLFALWLFLGMFVLMVLRTFLYKTKRDFEPASQMPLFDGKPVSTTEVK
jgi:cytochrome c oxidase cbb3-type subunit 4